MSVSVCVHAWRGQEATLGVFTPDPIYFVLNMRSLTGLELTKWTRLASRQAPEICLFLLWLWYCRSTRHYSQFYFMWVLEVNSGLHTCKARQALYRASCLPSPLGRFFDSRNLSVQQRWMILALNEALCLGAHCLTINITTRWKFSVDGEDAHSARASCDLTQGW